MGISLSGIDDMLQSLEQEGKTVVIMVVNDEPRAIIAIQTLLKNILGRR